MTANTNPEVVNLTSRVHRVLHQCNCVHPAGFLANYHPHRGPLRADAMAAISDGDAHSLASFFRGLISPIAVRNGPQHVCLKRAFNLMDSRWDVNAKSGQKEPPLAFGTSSVLPPELFAHVVDFLDGNEAMRITLTGKAWWRTSEWPRYSDRV